MQDTVSEVLVPPLNSQQEIPHNIENLLDMQGGADNSLFTLCDTNDNDGFTLVRDRNAKRPRVSSSGVSSTTLDEYKRLSIDDKLSVMFQHMNSLERNVDKCINISSRVDDLESQTSNMFSRITLLEYKSLDLEARSRRNNLLFGGIPEDLNEVCENTMANWFNDNLDIQCPSMPRLHRLGRFQRGKTRPIIANFMDFRETERILSIAHRLKGTKFSINRDYPQEIANARKQLWPEYKRLKNESPRGCKISLVYPAKIIKDGSVVADMFPDWNPILRGERVIGKMPFTNTTNGPLQSRAAHSDDNTQSATHSHVQTASQQQRTHFSSRSMSNSSRVPRSRRQSVSPPAYRASRTRAPSRVPVRHLSPNPRPQRIDPSITRPWVAQQTPVQQRSPNTAINTESTHM